MNEPKTELNPIDCDVAYREGTVSAAYCSAKSQIARLQKSTKTKPTVQKILVYIVAVIIGLIVGFFLWTLLAYFTASGPKTSYFGTIANSVAESKGMYPIIAVILTLGFGVIGYMSADVITNKKPWATKEVDKTAAELERDNAKIAQLAANEKFSAFPPLLAQ